MLAYLPDVIAAIAIFVVAALVSGAVAASIGKVMGDTPTRKIVATVLPALVMVIAGYTARGEGSTTTSFTTRRPGDSGSGY